MSKRAPVKCPWCSMWEGEIVRVFDSEQAFRDSDHSDGGDQVKNDELASMAVWPGKNNVGRKSADWHICAPVHPHCSHRWVRWYPPREKTEQEQMVDEFFGKSKGDRRRDVGKSAIIQVGVMEFHTCAHVEHQNDWTYHFLRESVAR